MSPVGLRALIAFDVARKSGFNGLAAALREVAAQESTPVDGEASGVQFSEGGVYVATEPMIVGEPGPEPSYMPKFSNKGCTCCAFPFLPTLQASEAINASRGTYRRHSSAGRNSLSETLAACAL
jgi:hypothetical protein